MTASVPAEKPPSWGASRSGDRRLTALVLAGSRRGAADPVAALAGQPTKALVPVDGQPMLFRVVQSLRACPSVARVVVAAGDGPDAGEAAGLLHRSGCDTLAEPMGTAPSPAGTVSAALASLGTPLLVTTADHPLLRPAMVEEFLASVPPGVAAAAAVVEEELFRAAFPRGRRTWLRFRDGGFSGCNLFLLATPDAARIAGFWRRLEDNRKKPWRMAAAIGPAMLLGTLFRRLSLDDAARGLGRRTGTRLAAIRLSQPEAAIDVDKPDDLRLVETILSRRAA
ncbi:nucleotidyltransferase family protein [Rhizosaccharibacter radicis]|uniref:NTP transferase domain-containing protein n=1 Tax=Rhizosaccharibacter radicis TaxID=2782605 RepID=A0ABT1VV24_9PROT|nr:NTP transferase domain-containing protein [Acetobacteraceae bacterium KSS12]